MPGSLRLAAHKFGQAALYARLSAEMHGGHRRRLQDAALLSLHAADLHDLDQQPAWALYEFTRALECLSRE